jgi:hypothetical protein
MKLEADPTEPTGLAGVADQTEVRTNAPRRSSFVALWIIVTALWTIATVTRMQRIWVPMMGWPAVLGNLYTWASLLLPPWMFAIILLAVKRLAMARH